EDLHDLRGQEARGTNRVREDMHVGTGAGQVVRAAGIGIGVNVKGQAGWGQTAKPDLGSRVVRLGAVEHRLRGSVAGRRSIREDDEILRLPRLGLPLRGWMPQPVR